MRSTSYSASRLRGRFNANSTPIRTRVSLSTPAAVATLWAIGLRPCFAVCRYLFSRLKSQLKDNTNDHDGHKTAFSSYKFSTIFVMSIN
jgi:hypothetical protein